MPASSVSGTGRVEGTSLDQFTEDKALRTLAKWSRLPPNRFQYVANADLETIRAVQRGVVFLMAFWSVDAMRAFIQLTEVMACQDTEGVELVVVDVDGAAPLASLPEIMGGVTGGYGQTLWVRKGEIVIPDRQRPNRRYFRRNLRELIGLP